MALGAAHARSRERFLALYDIARGACATQVAKRTGRHPQTVMGWLHTDYAHGPEALRYQRSGGRPPLLGHRRRAWRAGPRRTAPGGQSFSQRRRGKATLDAAASGPTNLSIQHAKTRSRGHRIISSAPQPPTY